MGTILGFFVFGAVGWYIVLAIFGLWTFYIVDKEALSSGIIELLLFLMFFQFLGKINIFEHILNNPLLVLLKILGYFTVGFIWSFIKWWLYVKEKAEEYRVQKDKFLSEHRGKNVTNLNEEWKRFKPIGLNKPTAMNHRSGIAVWVIYWPFSFVWALINDFIKKVIRQIVTFFRKWYQGIADRAFQGLDD